ncbi:MAG: hypothetical protein AAGH87_08065 [Pseudomonadota bacterium]
MLLRRISTHVKEQNWFAVFLDFFIVVVGVFIGIQVANWNEQRALKAQERSYLILIQEEIDRNLELSLNRLIYYTTVSEAAERTLEYLEGDEPCTDDCRGLLVDAFHASQFFAQSFSSVAFDDAVQLGFPSNETLRDTLTMGYRGLVSTNVNDQLPAFRDAVRLQISPLATRILWSGCWRLDETTLTESLSRDCEADLPADDALASMERMRNDPELAGLLRLWIGTIVLQNIGPELLEPALNEMSVQLAEEIARK